ncbi:MAG: hypothetical protein Q8Q09_10985 [Deltaproteobacteria bacterium]|nr:hypothetical protein [Deltaproteobacteria bacterium]
MAHRTDPTPPTLTLPRCSIALAALLVSGCVRLTPTRSVRAPAQPRPNLAHVAPDAAVPHDDAAMLAEAPLPPLFARKIGCIVGHSPRGFAWMRPSGGQPSTPLTHAELAARPWLWGQSGSGCAEPFTVYRRDGGIGGIGGIGGAQANMTQSINAAAEEYLTFGRVDDYQRWAPMDCLLPPSSRPLLDPGGNGPHGRKVYFLYASDRAAYLEHRDVLGQVLVKESWAPREVATTEAITAGGWHGQCATGESGSTRCVQPGAFNGLFVMLRGPVTAATDEGWTYATVDPRGDITASGRIATCMHCHARATHGRLFGIVTGAGVRWR